MPQEVVRGQLLLGDRLIEGAVVVDGGVIAGIARPGQGDFPEPTLEAEIVCPGFIDLQINGGFGADVGEDPEAIRIMARRLLETGVTSFLPTLITSPAERYPAAVAAFEEAADPAKAWGATALGLHLEGPLLSPRRKGAHPLDLIERADLRFLQGLIGRHVIRMVTLAPERETALAWIAWLWKHRVLVSLGHTDATFEQFEAGVDAGASMATHLFNAMSPFGHREPGAIGAAMVDGRVTAGLIADGIHADPAAVELAIRIKGYDRVALVTDMVAAGGMPDGTYTLGGREVILESGAVRLPDGTLAGSALTMDQAVRNVVAWTGTPVAHALRMACEIPARVLGMARLGRIRLGADADLVLLDRELRVQATIVRGERMYER